MKLPPVAEWALNLCESSLVPNSRIHPLQNVKHTWILREDESGFAYAAGKKRKYASLLPWLIKNQVEGAILIGSEASNHVLAGSQLLREKGIEPFLFLKESHAAQVLPNAFFNRILVPPENIRKLSRTEWENKEVILDEWMRKFQSENRIIFQIPEGAFCREALPGAMTLGSEILRHEETLNISFDTIYIDSGSGLTAAVLFHFFEAAGINKQIRIYLAAGKEADFEQAITITADWLQAGFGSYSQGSVSRDFIGASEPKFRGKLSGEKKEFIQTFARKHGILLDPFYNSGLFSLALKEIQSSNEKGNSLIIHSGGVAALLGYPEFDS